MTSPIIALLSTEPELLEVYTEIADIIDKLSNGLDQQPNLDLIFASTQFIGRFIHIVNSQPGPNDFKIIFNYEKLKGIREKNDKKLEEKLDELMPPDISED